MMFSNDGPQQRHRAPVLIGAPRGLQHRVYFALWIAGLALVGASPAWPADFQFQHHFISRELPVRDKNVGDYGLTALADLGRDGDRFEFSTMH